jgi:hypothetical protein
MQGGEGEPIPVSGTMPIKFSQKTEKKVSGATFLGVAVSLFVLFAIPQYASATDVSEITGHNAATCATSYSVDGSGDSILLSYDGDGTASTICNYGFYIDDAPNFAGQSMSIQYDLNVTSGTCRIFVSDDDGDIVYLNSWVDSSDNGIDTYTVDPVYSSGYGKFGFGLRHWSGYECDATIDILSYEIGGVEYVVDGGAGGGGEETYWYPDGWVPVAGYYNETTDKYCIDRSEMVGATNYGGSYHSGHDTTPQDLVDNDFSGGQTGSGAAMGCEDNYYFSLSQFGSPSDGEYFGIRITDTGGEEDITWFTIWQYNASTGLGEQQYYEGQLLSNYTYVVDMTPYEETVATSTEFLVEGEINVTDDDYEDGAKFRQWFHHRGSVQQVSALQAWETAQTPQPYRFAIEYDIDSAGHHIFSTTTDLSAYPEGDYYITGEIYLPTADTMLDNFFDMLERINGSAPTETEYRKTGKFTIGEQSFWDTVADATIASRERTLETCSVLSTGFDFFECLYDLVVPSQGDLQPVWEVFREQVLNSFPLGYITRFLEIVTLSDAVQPPALEYTYGTAAPEELQGRGVSFQIFDFLYIVNDIEADNGSGKNVWDIVMPFFDTIIALGVFGVILFDLLKLGLPDVSVLGDHSIRGGYKKKGSVPVSQLPDQKPSNAATYGEAQNIKIRRNLRNQ